jgi:hypothetical protein
VEIRGDPFGRETKAGDLRSSRWSVFIYPSQIAFRHEGPSFGHRQSGLEAMKSWQHFPSGKWRNSQLFAKQFPAIAMELDKLPDKDSNLGLSG